MALWKAKLPVLRLALIAALAMVAFAGHARNAEAMCRVDQPCPLPPEGEFVANLHTEVTGPETVVRDQSATYAFTVGNEGQRTAEAVDLEIDVPAGATYVSATGNCTTAPRNGGTRVTCALGSIRSGNSVTTSITVTPTTVGSLTITGIAYSDTPEDLPDDDQDSLTTQVIAPPQPYADLDLDATDSPDPVVVGSELTYHIRVTNTSVVIGYGSFGPVGPFDYPAAAENVTAGFRIPDGLEFVRTNRPTACRTETNPNAETDVTCALGTIGPNNDYEEVDVVLRATEAGTSFTTLKARSDTNDPNAANNDQLVSTALHDQPSVSVDDISVPEGTGAENTSATFRLALSHPAEETTAVAFRTTDGTAKSPWDYWSTAGQIVFNPGQQTKDINIPLIGDERDEPDEDFALLLVASQGAKLPDDRAVATIQDDDEGPAVSVSDASTTEGGSPATFTVSLAQESDFDVSVQATTDDGTAEQPGDYTQRGGRVTIPAGQLSTTVPVNVVDDSTDEPDEGFTLGLADPEHGTIGDGTGHATITDNDDPPTVSVDDVAVAEGNSGATPAKFTVSLSQASGYDVAVDAATHDGSAVASTATSRGDYTTRSGRITIPAGQTSAEFAVDVLGDTRDEPDEQFTLDLSNADLSTIADGSGSATITDDDQPGDPPETTITKGPGQWSATPRPAFELEASEDDDTFECRVVPDAFAACATPYTTRPLADGPHTVEVRAVKHEAVGGGVVQDIPDPTPASATFTVDTVAPTTTIAAAPPAVSNNPTPTFELRSGDPLAHFECRVSEAAFRGCAATERLARLADSEYLFEARAVDPAGNADATPAAHRFVIDTMPPETRIGTPRVSSPPMISGAAGTNRVAVGGSGQAMLAVGCPAGAQASCEGDVAIDANGVRVGQDSFDVAPGQNETVAVDLPPSVQSGVERNGTVNVVVTTVLEEPSAKRARARRAARTIYREDMVLTPDPRTPRVRDAGRTLAPRRGTLAIRLSCPRERGAAGCAGRLRILNAREKSLGSGNFKLRAGQSRNTKVKLTRSALRALRGRRSLDAAVEVTTRQAGAKPVVKRIQIQLRGGRR